MASGDVKLVYASDSAITVTNLHSLAASSTFLGGWESGAIDNSTNLYLDYAIRAKFTTHASNRQAGTIRLYLVAMFKDGTYPDAMDGTESTESWTDAEERDAVARLAGVIDVDNSASAVYEIHVESVAAVFGGRVPKKFVVFVSSDCATSTNAWTASAGSEVNVVGVYENVAA